MMSDRFIPIRFLSLIIQTILTILVLTDTSLFVEAALRQQELKSRETEYQLRIQLIVSVSLSLFCNVVEFIGMFSGISTFAYSQVIISSMCHCIGSALLIFFHLEIWSSQYFWIIFSICSLVPFLTECLVWIKVLVFHKNVYLTGR